MPGQRESVFEIWDDFRKGNRLPAATAWDINTAVNGVESVEMEGDRLLLEGERTGYVIPLNGERGTREFRRLYRFLTMGAKPRGDVYE